MNRNWDAWGHLRSRYESPGPRKILSLDGGGIRGVLTLEILVALERQLRVKRGNPRLVLSDYFDCFAGTSTGAIIASALAIGMEAEAVRELYSRVGKQAFTKEGLLSRWKSAYQDGPLERILKETFGNRTLAPKDLQALLLVVVRNATTDSAWPISSNPHAKYNIEGRDYRNLDLPLWQIVRASTAAPTYFPPEVVRLAGKKDERTFVFVDGGTTAYNNPAFLAYKMVTEPRYQLRWQTGERNLLVVSVGTGGAPVLGPTPESAEMNLVSNALHTLLVALGQAQVDQDMSCRMIGRCTFGNVLDREVSDLVPVDDAENPVPLSEDLGRKFLYVRYDGELTREGLSKLSLTGLDPAKVSKLDAVTSIPELQRIGAALAEKVTLEHLGGFV